MYISKNLAAFYRQHCDKKVQCTVLDVGAGTGGLYPYIEKFCGLIVAVEIKPTRALPNLVVASGSCLPFQEGAFSFVVSTDVLEHISVAERSKFLRENCRCCRNGLIMTYSKLHKNNPHQGGIRIFESLCRIYPDWYLEHNSNTIVDDERVKTVVKENGAKVVVLEPISGLLAVFFTGLPFFVRRLGFLLNLIAYLTTKLIDSQPYYSYGLTAVIAKGGGSGKL